MTEELRLLIRAEVEDAQKKLQGVQSQIKGVGKEAQGTSSKFSAAMKGVAKGAAVAVAAVAAIGTAIVATSKATEKYREVQAKLVSAFQASGKSAAQAKETYGELYRFLGDEDKAVEAANHLAKLATTQEQLAEWTNIAQGVYATFGDSLPIEGLTEAANETARVGQVTGVVADALNWAGISEDAFNASLAQTTTLEEREALLRSTLNGLYSDAAALYERNNSAILESRDAQNRYNEAMAAVGSAVQPAATAITNLGASLLNILAPALNLVMPYITAFISAIAEAFTWVSSLFGALSGSEATGAVAATATIANNTQNAASGVGALTQGYEAATEAAEKLKKQTAGFDELNVVSSGSSNGTGGIANPGGISGGGVSAPALNMANFNSALDGGASSAEKFAARVKGVFKEVAAAVSQWAGLFAPSFAAWQDAFETVSEAWTLSKDNFVNGGISIGSALATIGDYILNEFTPTVVNSFSENIAPVIGDVLGFAIQEAGLQFEWLGGMFEQVTDDIIIPSLDRFSTYITDIFDIVGLNWSVFGSDILSGVSEALAGLRTMIDDLYNNCIKPIADKIGAAWDNLWTNTLEPLVDFVIESVLDIANDLLILYNKTIAPIVSWLLNKIYPEIVRIVDFILDVVSTLTTGVAGVINGVIGIIRGLVKFITGVFTGDWKKAWEGVKMIMKGVFDSLVAIVKTPINLIIDAINFMISGVVGGINAAIKAINKLSFKVPDWVPEIGGQKFGFNIKEVSVTKIPKLATGGIVTSATQLIAGERGREAILPLENNTAWMDALADRIAARNSAPSKIVLQLDGKELGYASINSINQITKQTGKLQLAVI